MGDEADRISECYDYDEMMYQDDTQFKRKKPHHVLSLQKKIINQRETIHELNICIERLKDEIKALKG